MSIWLLLKENMQTCQWKTVTKAEQGLLCILRTVLHLQASLIFSFTWISLAELCCHWELCLLISKPAELRHWSGNPISTSDRSLVSAWMERSFPFWALSERWGPCCSIHWSPGHPGFQHGDWSTAWKRHYRFKPGIWKALQYIHHTEVQKVLFLPLTHFCHRQTHAVSLKLEFTLVCGEIGVCGWIKLGHKNVTEKLTGAREHAKLLFIYDSFCWKCSFSLVTVSF